MRNSNISRAMPPRHYWDSRFGIHVEEDFINSIQGIFSPSTNGGTGAAPTNWAGATALPSGWVGATRLTTGSTAAGVVSLGILMPIPLGLGPTWYEARIRPESLSDGTDTYTFRTGYIDTFNGEAVDGAFFRYTHSVNGGRFECVTRSNSVETAVDSGVTYAINSDFILRIEVNADASSAKFYINGTLVQTITTNIPNSLTRHTGYGMHLVKSLGTTARIVGVDYVKLDYIYTTART